MTISIRKRKASQGKIRLYLDYMHAGKRRSETLDLFLYAEPKNKVERDINKSNEQLADAIRAKRLVEYQTRRHGFADDSKLKGSFLDYFLTLTRKHRTSNGSYGNWLSAYQKLVLFTKDQNGVTFEEITPDWMERFKAYLLTARSTKSHTRLSQNSAHSYFNKIRAALNQAFEDRIIPEKITLRVKGIKEEDTHREYLTKTEVEKLMGTPCEIEVLKRAFLFSIMTGLRWSDIHALTWRNVEFDKEFNSYVLHYRQQKTKSAETLPISEQAASYMGKQGEAEQRVFIGLRYSAWVNLKLQQWVMAAGISKSITFHSGRHTHAVVMINEGVDIYTVSKLLGHKNIKTTQIYAKVIDERKLAAVNQFPKFSST
ncbi:site-specific integrase [Mucilaginibacter koreensis]